MTEMDQLSIEELKSAFKTLLEVATCPVCLGTVRINAVLCKNGHAICNSCKTQLQRCPTCQINFSDVKPTFVSQVVEVLPHPCRFQCGSFVKAKDDHENYCGSKPSICKVCNSTIFSKDIPEHVKQKHPSTKIMTMSMLFLFGGEPGVCNLLENFNPRNPRNEIMCASAHEQFFWCFVENEPNREMLHIKFILVPNGKPSKNWYSRVLFKSLEVELDLKIKLNLDPEAKNNIITVPSTYLHNFVDKENCLIFHTQITCSSF